MASNYTGNPTATQAPSGAPIIDTAPIASLPADGDPENAASVAQAMKVPMDWLAWLMKPRSRASQWAEAQRLYRSAALHKRFGIDHLGFPGGQIQRWEMNWEAAALERLGAGISSVTESGWQSSVTKAAGGAGNVLPLPPAALSPACRHILLEAANSAADRSVVTRVPPCLFHADVSFGMDWSATIPSLQNYAIGMGFNTESVFASGGHGAIAQFFNVGGSGNWRCHTDDGTTLNDQDSGVAVDTAKHRFRIAYQGANVDDAATQRVLFFIDGALVGNLIANMPSVPVNPYAIPCFIIYNSGGTGGSLDVGPVRFADNLFVDAF